MDKSMLEEMVSVTKGLVAVNSINSNDGGELLASQYRNILNIHLRRS